MKINLIQTCLLAVLLGLSAAVQAQFTYVTNDGAITITGYTGSGGNVSIPATINGLAVTAIGEYAFSDDSLLTSVTIPNSVITVGDLAFWGCDMASLNIPDSVTNIGYDAFSDCYELTNLTIGAGVTSIGDEAFEGCVSLTAVTIPDSVTMIGDAAFSGCANLSAVTVAPQNLFYSSLNGMVLDKTQTTLVLYPPGRDGSDTLPSSVTSIGKGAFEGCILSAVTIPDTVTSIGDNAFIYDTALTNVVIGNAVATVGIDAFFDCYSLVKVFFTGNAPAADPSAFSVIFHSDFGPIPGYDPATVYYLPNTTGWSTNLAGLPTALWLPQAQTSDASFGVRSNQFGFNIVWAPGTTVIVEAAANLANPVWTPLATNSLTGGASYFSDPQWTNYPARFYRLNPK